MDANNQDSRFSTFHLDTEDGVALINVDLSYKDFPEKKKHQWMVMLQLEINEPNEAEHATKDELEELDASETDVIEFLEETQSIHLVGRVTLGGIRDSILYMDKPNFNEKSLTKILDDINEDRNVNFAIEEDPHWDIIDEFFED